MKDLIIGNRLSGILRDHRLIYYFRNNASTEKINWIEVSSDDGTQLSFMYNNDYTNAKIDNEGIDPFCPNESGRKRASIHKTLIRLFDDEGVIERIEDVLKKEMLPKSALEVQFLPSSDIAKIYAMRSAMGSESLGNSCMRNMDKLTFEVYKDNCAGILAIINDENDLESRALVWKIDDDYFVDRIYGNEKSINTMIDFINNKNWYRKESQNYSSKTEWMQKNEYERKSLRIELISNLSNYSSLPYFDTFSFTDCYGNYISNDDGHIELTKTNGESFDNLTGNWSEVNDCYISEDDSFYCEILNDYIYEHQARYINEREIYVFEDLDEVFWSDNLNEYILTNDTDYIFVDSEDDYYSADDVAYIESDDEYILVDDASFCEINGEYYRSKDVVHIEEKDINVYKELDEVFWSDNLNEYILTNDTDYIFVDSEDDYYSADDVIYNESNDEYILISATILETI